MVGSKYELSGYTAPAMTFEILLYAGWKFTAIMNPQATGGTGNLDITFAKIRLGVEAMYGVTRFPYGNDAMRAGVPC